MNNTASLPSHFGNALYDAWLNDSPATTQALAILQAVHRTVEAAERGRIYRIAYYLRAVA
tara:strand:- start:29 stop:208 length:180 start_codon:yes stop_codon:yes gene_type:complete